MRDPSTVIELATDRDGCSEIRVWTLGGDTIHILSGHTSFVYSLALLPNGDIVSSGEDRSVRVWKGMNPNTLPVATKIS